ncbi:hypothetical protein KIH32_19885 [Pseudomonas fluorescens]|uniref:hypothetical protein n=1 Tax=Pseudomonas fluorescens TaxID=294 RepID=UPI001BD9C2D5|nr:hypothetical protein [Pseudomonas fluorescens]MBT0626171.1 hypothetical protein [Pseudomonas fluorescens]
MSYKKFAALVFTTPMLWLNISTLVIGVFYWKGLSTSDSNSLYLAMVIFFAFLSLGISLWLYFSEDKEVRKFLKDQNIKPFFTTPKEILKLIENPKKAYSYATRTHKKYQVGLTCAAFWAVLWFGLSFAGPAEDTISGFAPVAMPWIGAVVSLILCIALTVSIYQMKRLADNKWFSLKKSPPLQSDAPDGTLKDAVLMWSPIKLVQWRDTNYQVINLDQLQGTHMPKQPSIRDEILWTFLPDDAALRKQAILAIAPQTALTKTTTNPGHSTPAYTTAQTPPPTPPNA